MQWETKTDPLAALSAQQEEHLDVLSNLWQDDETTVSQRYHSNMDTQTKQIKLVASYLFIDSGHADYAY